MATTLEELERRLAAVERELAALRRQLTPLPVAETPAERGARLLRGEPPAPGQAEATWAAAMKQMGIQGEPVSAEKLREMILACGVNPESNEASRGIIEMREE
jgi:hypothetical protein